MFLYNNIPIQIAQGDAVPGSTGESNIVSVLEQGSADGSVCEQILFEYEL